MTTAQDVLDGARRYLSDSNPARNQVLTHTLDTGSSTDGTVVFRFPLNTIREGTRFAAGLQTYYVWSVSDGNLSAEVHLEEGPLGVITTGTVVLPDPRWSNWELFQAANDELRDLSSPVNGLYQVKTKEFTYSTVQTGYDLGAATDIMSIYEVSWQSPGPYKAWIKVPSYDYRLSKSADTTDFTSGQSLDLFSGGYPGHNVRIVYKAAFGSFTDLTSTVSSTGLPDSASDILYTGVAIRAMSGQEIARNDLTTQGDVRRAGEVPAGAVGNSVQGAMRIHAMRVTAEAARLMAQYPDSRD